MSGVHPSSVQTSFYTRINRKVDNNDIKSSLKVIVVLQGMAQECVISDGVTHPDGKARNIPLATLSIVGRVKTTMRGYTLE